MFYQTIFRIIRNSYAFLCQLSLMRFPQVTLPPILVVTEFPNLITRNSESGENLWKFKFMYFSFSRNDTNTAFTHSSYGLWTQHLCALKSDAFVRRLNRVLSIKTLVVPIRKRYMLNANSLHPYTQYPSVASKNLIAPVSIYTVAGSLLCVVIDDKMNTKRLLWCSLGWTYCTLCVV